MTPPFDAILFDCDGVIVDSEPILFDLLRSELASRGLPLSRAVIARDFVGGTIASVAERARDLGADLPPDWPQRFYARLYPRLAQGTPAEQHLPGAPRAARPPLHPKAPAACARGSRPGRRTGPPDRGRQAQHRWKTSPFQYHRDQQPAGASAAAPEGLGRDEEGSGRGPCRKASIYRRFILRTSDISAAHVMS